MSVTREQFDRLTGGQRALLDRAVTYGETRTVTWNERKMALADLTRQGFVTTEPLTERTLIVRPTPEAKELVERFRASPRAYEQGGDLGAGGRRQYAKRTGNGGGS